MLVKAERIWSWGRGNAKGPLQLLVSPRSEAVTTTTGSLEMSLGSNADHTDRMKGATDLDRSLITLVDNVRIIITLAKAIPCPGEERRQVDRAAH